MAAIVDVTLLRPWWLLALPLVAAVALGAARRARSPGDWGRVIDPAMMATLRDLGRVDTARGGGAAWRLPVVAGLLVLGLAGPAIERRDAVTFRNLDAVVLVVDPSEAFAGGPGWPAVQTAAQFAVTALGTRPAATVVFADGAHVATDLTVDHRELSQTLSILDTDTIPMDGQSLPDALALAARILTEGEVLGGDVIVLSDLPAGPETLARASDITATGARLSVLGTSPPAALAQVGGGRVFGPTDTAALHDWIADEGRTERVRAMYPMLFWADLGRWCVLAALVPLILGFRRGAA